MVHIDNKKRESFFLRAAVKFTGLIFKSKAYDKVNDCK